MRINSDSQYPELSICLFLGFMTCKSSSLLKLLLVRLRLTFSSASTAMDIPEKVSE